MLWLQPGTLIVRFQGVAEPKTGRREARISLVPTPVIRSEQMTLSGLLRGWGHTEGSPCPESAVGALQEACGGLGCDPEVEREPGVSPHNYKWCRAQ